MCCHNITVPVADDDGNGGGWRPSKVCVWVVMPVFSKVSHSNGQRLHGNGDIRVREWCYRLRHTYTFCPVGSRYTEGDEELCCSSLLLFKTALACFRGGGWTTATIETYVILNYFSNGFQLNTGIDAVGSGGGGEATNYSKITRRAAYRSWYELCTRRWRWRTAYFLRHLRRRLFSTNCIIFLFKLSIFR